MYVMGRCWLPIYLAEQMVSFPQPSPFLSTPLSVLYKIAAGHFSGYSVRSIHYRGHGHTQLPHSRVGTLYTHYLQLGTRFLSRD